MKSVIRKAGKKEVAHMACLAHPVSQPSWLPSRKDQYDVTVSSWVSVMISHRMFSLYSTDYPNVRQKMALQCSLFIAMLWFSLTWFACKVFLHKVFTTLSVLVSVLCILYHNFYFIFSSEWVRSLWTCELAECNRGISVTYPIIIRRYYYYYYYYYY
jgi:hypothetical protein